MNFEELRKGVRLFVLLAGLSVTPPVFAEDAAVAPAAPAPVVIDGAVTARIDKFKAVIKSAGWNEVRSGFERMQVLLEPGNTLFAFRMNPRNFRLRLVESTVPAGSLANAELAGAKIVN